MANGKDIEATIGGWYENVPHLPKEGRTWLADNVWWLALIGAVLCAFGLFTALPLLFLLLVGSVPTTVSFYGTDVSRLNGFYQLSILITLVSYVTTTVLLALSIRPLKNRTRRGWELLFWAYLINFICAIAGAIISLSASNLLGAVIGAAIGGYLLFEIRSYFVVKHRPAEKAKVVKNGKK